MKIPKQINVKTALILLVISILLTSVFFYAFASTPSSTFYISSGVYPGAPSYTIWKEGANYFAKDANGLIAYSGTNASEIIQNCVNTLTTGGTICIKAGEYSIDSTITIDLCGVYIVGEQWGHHTGPVPGDGTRPNTATTLKLTTVNIPIFRWTKGTQHVYFGGLSNMVLWGQELEGATAVLVDGASDLIFEDIFVNFFGGNGFDIHATTDGIWNIWISRTLVESCMGVAYYLHSSATYGIEGVWFSNAYAYNDTYAIYIQGLGSAQPVRNVQVAGCRLVWALEDAIVIEGNKSYRIQIYDSRFFEYGINEVNRNCGVRVGVNDTTPFDILISNNIIGDLWENANRHAVILEGHCYGVDVLGNNFIHENTINLNRTSDGGGLSIHYNQGFNTEASGAATISASTYTWVVHTLTCKSGTAPTSIIVTPQSDITGDFWVPSRNETHFKIEIDSSQTVSFFWRAELQP